MGVGLPTKRIPGFIEYDGKYTINPYWVYSMYFTCGLPKELVIEYEDIVWTSWHEAWFFHFECLTMINSGANIERIRKNISLFMNTKEGQEVKSIIKEDYYEQLYSN